jgi:hypothetical protein
MESQNPFVTAGSYTGDNGETLLHCYIEQGLWEQALERLESHPQDAIAGPTTPSGSKQNTLELIVQKNLRSPLHLDTILKLVTELCLIEEEASAEDAPCRTSVMRKAIWNARCPAAVLAILLGRKGAVGALSARDTSGKYLLDVLLQRLRDRGSPRSEVMTFLEVVCTSPAFQEVHGWQKATYSPLNVFFKSSPLPSFEESKTKAYASTVMITESLLHHAPWMATLPSPFSGCLPLHAAVRCYGDRLPLIEVLCKANPKIWLHRDQYGYLPLHTACHAGVPPSVLKRLIEATAAATGGTYGQAWQVSGLAPRLVLASDNKAGDTPTDLVWERYITGRRYDVDLFQPNWEIRSTAPWTENRFEDILRHTVARATDTDNTTVWFLQAVWPSLCLLWGATCPTHLAGDLYTGEANGSSGYPLHQVAVLCQPARPSLITPWLDWALLQHGEQVSRLDTCHRTVLHYAVHVAWVRNKIEEPQQSLAWKTWIDKLLEAFPDAVGVMDNDGRLPLHTALDGSKCGSVEGIPDNSLLDDVISNLVELSPPLTLDRPDPLTGLVPAFQAAAHPLVGLATVYELLKKKLTVLSR